MADTDLQITEVQRKIDREKALINGATHMRQSTNNAAVQARADSNIKDGKRNIAYLEEQLRKLQIRKVNDGAPPPPAHGYGTPSTQRKPLPGSGMDSGPTPPPKERSGYYQDSGDYGDPGPGGYSQGGTGMMPPRAPYGDPRPYNVPIPKARPNFSKLDLIKYDTPYLGPKIQLMLSQLEFKLSVEKQYKAGIEKMVRLYQDEGDRKSRADAEGRRIESNQKVQLLKQALKRYMDLHVGIDDSVEGDDDSLNAPNMRKPLSGHLEMRINAIRDVDHAASSRFSRGPETFIIMKVEDNVRAKTRATRNDRWMDEIFTIDIDKANEIELTVYDKSGDRPTPIAFLWIRISDIAEEMRRKRIEAELQQGNWVTADKMGNGGSGEFAPPPTQAPHMPPGDGASAGPAAGMPQHAQPAMIDSWFSLEPAGRIHLSMSFQKHTGQRRPFDIGLNRQGAVRQKKEEVHEKQGHKFVKQQFYNVMRCALCGDLLKYSAGMQCEDCKYTCHTKCYPKVVTKCISKANYETDPDEEKINHRIPHRFENFSNIGANWCCHCGYLLPIGRKNAKKCNECGLTCHAQCQHLVPDFCGMSMIVANEILETIQRTKQHNKSSSVSSGLSNRTLRQRPGPQSPTQSFISDGSTTIASPGKQSYEESPKPSDLAVTAAQNMFTQSVQSPAPQPPPQQQQRPAMQKTATSNAAIAAATSSMRPPSQTSQSYSNYGSQHAPDRYANARPPRTESPQQQQPPQHAAYDPGAYASYNRAQQQQQQQAIMQQARPAQVPQSPAAPQYPPSHQQQAQPRPQVPQQQVVKADSAPASKGPRIGLDHFNFLAVLGKGNFGKVMLAEAKSSKKLYAIKVLKKEFIIENDEVESTKSEKRVFLIANKERHPFLLNLHACFQTETRVYFVMEYISGGDLMLHIQRGQFGLKRAQFYAAEVCLALKYFHENGVIYRDLKLDNILLTLDGHIKIADYGLCKENMWFGSTTSTFCGTPEFMAPEILLDKKYGRAVDWWAFGVLIYQMLLQQSPFRGEDEDEIYDAILADEPLYPIHMPRDSVSILQKLLTREPELRLGSGRRDAEEIMEHPFFKGVDWDDIYNKRVPTPYKPQIKDAKDTSNFDSEFTSVTPVLTPVQSVLSAAHQEEFRGFSYSADFI
ncbi:Serine/threonine kinase [Lithohypha guttulata]|uniref:protein kinase C n=1 Tax=Lithohypha guttulata TaxID=1690604 RepID=A0AAN7YG72_9EURO|nr:Serine/threonine kinase [Lithohypha guttulata]KAK5085397.1 Serine/threonine kinase [Lithohypha guttulata]